MTLTRLNVIDNKKAPVTGLFIYWYRLSVGCSTDSAKILAISASVDSMTCIRSSWPSRLPSSERES